MTIRIDALTFECILGILDFERLQAQKIIIDVELLYDFTSGFIDYAAVVEHIQTSMTSNSFHLIEDAILSLQRSLKEDFSRLKSLSLTIYKPDILPNCRVSVTQKINY